MKQTTPPAHSRDSLSYAFFSSRRSISSSKMGAKEENLSSDHSIAVQVHPESNLRSKLNTFHILSSAGHLLLCKDALQAILTRNALQILDLAKKPILVIGRSRQASNNDTKSEDDSSNLLPQLDNMLAGAADQGRGCTVMPPFTPYSARVPWHNGSRAILSRVFPKYGNYCGPNWSSGRDKGSLLWDAPPVDWLDYCCFQHDVGYDTHSQLELYKADIALLQCLTRMPREKLHPGNPGGYVRETYRTLCILGLTRFLIPYRKMLLQQQKLAPGLAPKQLETKPASREV